MHKAIYETADRIQILLRVFVTALFVACVLFIWHNSMENAEVSAGRSGRVTKLVNQVVECVGGEAVTEHFVRKLAHFSEYGLEGVLTVFLFMAYSLKPVRHLRTMALTGFFTATVDESIQFFSAGRSPGLGDVCIDMAGFICGMLSVLAVWHFARGNKESTHCKDDNG